MRKLLLALCGYAVFALVAPLCVEGVYRIARWKHADRSIVYDAYRKLSRAVAENPATRLPTASRDEIESLITDLIKAGVGMGNVPYKELVTGRAAINELGPDGCRSPRANAYKITTYIRSADYNLFDPPRMFFDKQANLGERLSQFVEKYVINISEFNSKGVHEPIMLPAISSSKKIPVVGDSVAAGSMIDDSETISSQLQRRDITSQYINLGVNGAAAGDIICRLKSVASTCKGLIKGLIYVYSENDFDPKQPFGEPQEVVAFLKNYAVSEQIRKVTIVFALYIYNIIPQITRFPGSRGAEHPEFHKEEDALKKQTLAAGFEYVNTADIVLEEARARRTDLPRSRCR